MAHASRRWATRCAMAGSCHHRGDVSSPAALQQLHHNDMTTKKCSVWSAPCNTTPLRHRPQLPAGHSPQRGCSVTGARTPAGPPAHMSG
jgi:hypothetical protein